MLADGGMRSAVDTLTAFLTGRRDVLHVLVEPDAGPALASHLFELDLPIHVRTSILVPPGMAITLRGELGAMGCPECDPTFRVGVEDQADADGSTS